MSAIAKCVNVSRSYGSVHAVRDANLEIKQGEVIVLVGANGCGKTTLIEILLGLRRRDRGTVQVFGYDPREQRSRLASRIGVTLQGASLHTQVTPKEHLQFIAALYGRKRSDADRIIAELGMSDIQHRHFGRLSGGQQRRVLVGSSLLPAPELLVLDEPTSGVDLESRTQLWAVLRASSATQGTSVLTTTHDLNEAEDHADRVLVMRKGVMIASGSPQELIQRTGFSRVVSLRFTGNQMISPPTTRQVTTLQNELGAVLFGCESDGAVSLLKEWADTVPGLRKFEPRLPSLGDAYLCLSGLQDQPEFERKEI